MDGSKRKAGQEEDELRAIISSANPAPASMEIISHFDVHGVGGVVGLVSLKDDLPPWRVRRPQSPENRFRARASEARVRRFSEFISSTASGNQRPRPRKRLCQERRMAEAKERRRFSAPLDVGNSIPTFNLPRRRASI